MVRTARVEDADAIAALHVRTWQAAYRGLVPDQTLQDLDPALRAERWRETLLEGSTRVFVSEINGGLAGFVACGPSRDPDMVGEGELYAIYVDPRHWGAGIGRELLSTGEEAMRRLGYREAGLWVLEDNPRARRFYEAAGWILDETARKLLPDGAAAGLVEVRYRRSL